MNLRSHKLRAYAGMSRRFADRLGMLEGELTDNVSWMHTSRERWNALVGVQYPWRRWISLRGTRGST